MFKTALSWSLSGILLLALPATLTAQDNDATATSESRATQHLRTHHDRIMRVLRRRAASPAAEERRKTEVTEVIRELLDLDAMGRAALGRHWADHSASEQQQFLSILRQLVERNYRQNLEGTKNYQVRYGTETHEGDRHTVHTTARDARHRRTPAITINYDVTPSDGGFRVIDIVTDGVSMVRNYRSQFGRIIRRDGWDALIARMQERLSEQE